MFYLLFSVMVWCLSNKICWLDISLFSLWSLVTAHCIEILDKDFRPQVVQKVLPIVCETLEHYRRHMSKLDWTLRKGVPNNAWTNKFKPFSLRGVSHLPLSFFGPKITTPYGKCLNFLPFFTPSPLLRKAKWQKEHRHWSKRMKRRYITREYQDGKQIDASPHGLHANSQESS